MLRTARRTTNLGIITDVATAEAASGLDCRLETLWPFGTQSLMCAIPGETGYIFSGQYLDDPIMRQALQEDIARVRASKAAGTSDGGLYLYTQTTNQVADPTPAMQYNLTSQPTYTPPAPPPSAPPPGTNTYTAPPPPQPVNLAPASTTTSPTPPAQAAPTAAVPPPQYQAASTAAPPAQPPVVISGKVGEMRERIAELAAGLPWWAWLAAGGGLIAFVSSRGRS